MEKQKSRTDTEKVEVKNPIEVVFDEDVPLTSAQKDLVETVVNNFAQLYNLWVDDYPEGIQFSTFFIPWTLMEWWWSQQSVAKTKGNRISFNVNKNYNIVDNYELTNIIRHELGHTLPSKKLPAEFVLSTGDSIKAIEWWKIHIMTKDNVETAFNLFEEAFCEAIAVDQAANTVISYNSDPRYFAIWSLMMNLCRHKDISITELVSYDKESNILDFLKKILGKETTFTDLEYVISKFNELWVIATQLLTDSFQDPQLEKTLWENIRSVVKRISWEVISH